MKVIFNKKEYKKNARQGGALKNLCFDIFKHYLELNKELSYKDLQAIFNKWHCNNNFVVLSKKDWENKTENLRKRYFSPIQYNSENIYFTTQWGNNGGDCDNINNMIDFAKKENFNIKIVDDLAQEVLINIKNIILYGAPGVGKTHNYKNLISMIEEGKTQKEIFDTVSKNQYIDLDNETFETIKQENRVEFVTFHQSYSYEDFIEGFRPNESGNIKLEDGIFKDFCVKALMGKEKNFYMIIDEINRGNISKIFGELITLIEEDKRNVYEVTLPYSKHKFTVPLNLYIIATMNSTDKSIATIDIALRRRFTFLKMKPNIELISFLHAKELFTNLNKFILENLNEDYMLGHSYFMNIQNDDDLDFVKEYKIKPLLEEYFYVDKVKLDEVLDILKIDNSDA